MYPRLALPQQLLVLYPLLRLLRPPPVVVRCRHARKCKRYTKLRPLEEQQRLTQQLQRLLVVLCLACQRVAD